MKVLVVVSLSLLAIALCDPIEKADKKELRINGENGWYIPLVDRTFAWMSKEEFKIADENFKPSGETIVDFYLYTRSNPKNYQKINKTTESVQASYFDSDRPTKFVIHGWHDSFAADLNVDIRDAWLQRDDCNVIIVDWSSRSGYRNYLHSFEYVPETGKIVGEFLDFLNSNFGLSFVNVTIIGHSFGAHAAGFAAKAVQNGRVNIIIALDPYLALYDYDDVHSRLNSDDADYVEAIYTNGNKSAFLKPIGKATFYPNGGVEQPGCYDDNSGLCSHFRSIDYYVEAITSDSFLTIGCPDYESAVKQDCGTTISSVRMGNPSNIYNAEGYYYVPVNENRPYGVEP